MQFKICSWIENIRPERYCWRTKSCIIICCSLLGKWSQSWKGVTYGLFESNLVSFHPMVLKIFKDFLFFNQSKDMAWHDSHLGFKARSLDTIEKDDYPRSNTSSKIDPIWTRVLQKIKMLRTTDAKWWEMLTRSL